MNHTEQWQRIAHATRIGLAPEVASRQGPPRIVARPSLIASSSALVMAQVPVVRRNIWLASAVVMGIAVAATLAAPRGAIFAAVTPLIAAVGVAFVYGVENDPSIEIALATPTSPRVILLARLALVCGYDLVLALVASLLLALAGQSSGGPEAVILAWLGPMFLLAALSVAIAVRFGTLPALAAACSFWLIHLSSARALERWIAGLAGLDAGSATVVALGLALVVFTVAVVRLPRELRPA